MLRLAALLCLIAGAAASQTLVARHTVRSGTVLEPKHLAVLAKTVPGALSVAEAAIGLETRVVLYAGRPITRDQLGAPALVDRNQTVTLVYRSGGLAIVTEGRALGRGGYGDMIPVMNLASRSIVEGEVTARFTVSVGPQTENRR
jgi:flagella basal body P-ring formation protein FlgA